MLSDTDTLALQRMAQDFTEGFNTGDIDRIMQYYGDQYVDVNLRKPVQSHEERRAYYLKVMSSGMRINVVPDEIRVLGEIALVRGTIQITSAASEQRELRYLEVLTKDPSGKWKSLWGMDGPIQEYKPEAS